MTVTSIQQSHKSKMRSFSKWPLPFNIVPTIFCYKLHSCSNDSSSIESIDWLSGILLLISLIRSYQCYCNIEYFKSRLLSHSTWITWPKNMWMWVWILFLPRKALFILRNLSEETTVNHRFCWALNHALFLFLYFCAGFQNQIRYHE